MVLIILFLCRDQLTKKLRFSFYLMFCIVIVSDPQFPLIFEIPFLFLKRLFHFFELSILLDFFPPEWTPYHCYMFVNS